MTKLIELGAGWSAAAWRERATKLFSLSARATTPATSELLRRRAVAADNIADAVDLEMCMQSDADTPTERP